MKLYNPFGEQQTEQHDPSHKYMRYGEEDKSFLVFGGNLYYRSSIKEDYRLLKKDYVNKK